MKDRNRQVLDWAIDMVSTEYADDIDILAVYGSYVNGNSHPLSDVDFFFIPKDKRGHEAARTFIIGGVGYDLFPMSWERVEGLSMLKEAIVPLLGDSVVVYQASDVVLHRFMAMRNKLSDNLHDTAFMHSKELDNLGKAENVFNSIMATHDMKDTRLACGRILLLLSDAVAYSNGTYFHKGLKGQYDDLKSMASLPEGFLAQYDACIEATGVQQLKSAAAMLLTLCRSHLNPQYKASESIARLKRLKPGEHAMDTTAVANADCPGPVDYQGLVSFYEEALSTFNKIYHYCSPKCQNHRMAFISAVSLQKVLDEEAHALDLDILSSFDYRDLASLAAATKSAEEKLVSFISAGATIKRYATVEEFVADRE